jgi:hypothetical protein
MTNLFKPIEGSAVVLYNHGVYKQVELAERNGEVYAKWNAGFIRLMNSGFTSYGDVKWSDISLPSHVKPIVKLSGAGAVTVDNA